MQKPHFDRVKPTTKTRCPRRVIAICCEHSPTVHPANPGVKHSVSTLNKWAITQKRFTESGRWNGFTVTGITALDHWAKLYALIRGRRQAWIVTPSVSEWLAVTDGYAELTAGRLWIPKLTRPHDPELNYLAEGDGNRPGYLILGGPTEIITGRLDRTEVHVVNAGNYGMTDWLHLLDTYCPGDGHDAISWTGADRWCDLSDRMANALADWYTGLIDHWRQNDCGTWGHTAAQLSHSYYRRKHCSRAVVVHKNHSAHQLERKALFGGRAEVYRWAPFRGRVYRLDVRSMYPAILATHPCPVALSVYGQACSTSDLADASKTHCCLASVTIRTPDDLFPVRVECGGFHESAVRSERIATEWRSSDMRTMFPTGEYHTFLCGPELEVAIKLGLVRRVWEHAIYRKSEEFQPLMRELLAMRRQAIDRGDVGQEALAKLLANSFAGKWARRPGGWTTDARFAPPREWSEWVEVDPETNQPVRCRSLGWLPQVYRPRDDQPHGAPIILAWLTSMGRQQIYKLRQIAGVDECLAIDTDGLWVTDAGHDALRKFPTLWGDQPGQLRVVEELHRIHFLTPRHYLADGKWTMAGFAEGFTVKDMSEVTDFVRQNLYPADTKDGPGGVRVMARRCDVSQLRDAGRWRLPGGVTAPWFIDWEAGPDPVHDRPVAFNELIER